MSSQMGYGTGSSMLFQSMNDDLNASLATADELSREFSSLLQEASASPTTQPSSQTISVVPRERSTPMVVSSTSSPASSPSTVTVVRDTAGGGGSSRSSPISSTSSSAPFSPSSTSPRPLNNVISGAKNRPSSPVHQRQSTGPPRSYSSSSSDHFTYGQMSPNQSPRTQRRNSPSRYNRSPRGSITHLDAGPLQSPGSIHAGQRSPQPGLRPRGSLPHIDPGPMASPTLQVPYDGAGHGGRRSPQPDRSSSPRPYSHPMSSTLPRNFGPFKQADDSMQRQNSAGKWNETDLDASYERKAHHTYNKTDWLRPSVPNSNWKESNLDGSPPGPSPKKDSLSRSQQQPSHSSLQPSHASLPRNARISVPPDVSSPAHSPYHPQPIISRISIPPTTAPPRQRKPIPLSVIMRLQNPTWDPYAYHPMAMGMEDVCPYQGAMPMPMAMAMSRPMPMPMPMPMPREFFHQPMHPPSQLHAHEMMQPAFYNEVLNPGDVDAEIERLDLVPAAPEMPRASDKAGGEAEQAAAPAPPRPLSPTRLQPVVAPEAQSQDLPDLEELLRIRAEIPRALKRRGSVQSGSPAGQADPGSQSVPLKKASHYEPNQYKHLINKLFRRKGPHHKKEHGQESSSSSEGEEIPAQPPPALPGPLTSTPVLQDHRGYHSILRRASREHRGTGRRARLSPLVLLLDGSLVGELDTVKRAVQEMSDPSQPNDEGITALHNAICGGHYNVVDFLVRIGANVSTPDSHGWTPLHCAASCNDRILCEFLVRNGAAVMAMTESDGATAAQKCDPYAVGYEECVSFLRGVEEAMGVENSGVLYALWSYPAQAPDELSFKEGDMVTILQKPEGVHWWWASLCGREGFVPNNYFGLFPKVRPKSLC